MSKKRSLSSSTNSNTKNRENKIERLQERFICEKIKADLYENFPARYRKEREELEAFVNLTQYFNSNFEKYMELPLQHLEELLSP